jgi:hypothetical protein
MLDYPRYFNQQKGHLALRVMFWWGNYFLIQLHVSGIYKDAVVKKTEEWVKKGIISGSGWWIGYPEDPWNFLVPQQGIQESSRFDWQEEFTKSGIFKIMKTVPLNSADIDENVAIIALLLQEAVAELG